jgi:hypothetical protein
MSATVTGIILVACSNLKACDWLKLSGLGRGAQRPPVAIIMMIQQARGRRAWKLEDNILATVNLTVNRDRSNYITARL